MKQQCTSLPGIVEIRWLDATLLSPNLEPKHLAGLPIAVLTEGTPLTLHGEPQCQAVEEHDNNGRVEKATLTFLTTDSVPRRREVAWVARQATGQWWLIGTAEPRYPTVKVSYNTGLPSGERAVSTVEVTHQATKALLPVVL